MTFVSQTPAKSSRPETFGDAAARAAEVFSHSEAVAQYQRALRFAALLSPASVAALYDKLFTELALVDRWAEAGDAWARC